jgi:hypothetical protein
MDLKAMKEKLPDRRRTLNGVDVTFQLPKEEYTFEHEIGVVEILRKEHSNILKETQAGAGANQSSAVPDVPHSPILTTPPPPPAESEQGHIAVDIPENETNNDVSSDNEMV